MTTIRDIADWMSQQAPLSLSESWDNTGLLLGDRHAIVQRVQTCLTLTDDSVAEAVDRHADLVIAHHPLPFRPLAKITTDSLPGGLLWQLASSRIAVYSPHTAWDSAERGINAMLCERLGLQSIQPLVPATVEGLGHLGAGRFGQLSKSASLREISAILSQCIPECRPRGVDSGKLASRIAVACGSGGSLLGAAIQSGCDLFLTGEATFHTCLEAQAASISMLMIGHFASERFSLAELAALLHQAFPNVDTWASSRESDPVVQL